MFSLERLSLIFIVLVSTFVFGDLLIDRVRRAQIKRRLRKRESLDDKDFQRAYYAADKDLAKTATRVRSVLAKNLRMSLESIRPSDRLDEDLDTQISKNILLFDALEDEFGISTGIDEWQVFSDLSERLVTFSDLVDYVHDSVPKVEETPVSRKAVGLGSRMLELVEHFVPVACIGGIAFAVVGHWVLGLDWAWRIGSAVFMSGIAGFLISVLAVGLHTLTFEIRDQGMTWVRSHPWRAIWIGVLSSAVIMMIGAIVWGVLRVFTGGL